MNFFKPIKLVISTPCYGSQCFTEYTSSLLATSALLANEKINLQVNFIVNESLIQRARNNLVARFLADPDNTHLMFIDADIGFDPKDIVSMLKCDKDVIGGLYPKKSIEYPRLAEPKVINTLASLIKDVASKDKYIEELQPQLLNYVYTEPNEELSEHDKITRKFLGIQKVEYIGTGFMMIKREVLEKMILHYEHTQNVSLLLSPEENKYSYSLFDCETRNKVYLSEDYLFCRRWLDLGGEIYAYVKANLTHVGLCRYNGNPSKILY